MFGGDVIRKLVSCGFFPVVSLLIVISTIFILIAGELLMYVLFSGWTDEFDSITPLRWVIATVVPVLVSIWGLRKKSLSLSGALLTFVVGFCVTLAHYSFLFCILAFFISSSKATKYKQEVKREFEDDFKEGGQRNWLNVICNGGMATELSLLYLLEVGSADLAIDFRHQYRASWLGVAVLGAIACCNGDTWASEFGTVLAKGDPFLITTWQKVPKGTNGAVTVVGLICSLLGGLVIGLAYFIGILMSAIPMGMVIDTNQLLVILLGGLGGLFGSIIDSLIGASFQFSGRDVKTGKIVEVAREGVVPIAGKMILDNHSVNLVSSILTALLLPNIAYVIGM